MYDKRTFVLSSALLTFFFIQTRSTSVNFFHLGCFQDNRTRAMPEMLGNWRFDSNAIQRCAQAAKRAGYLVFGVQYAGECWSGPLAHVTYKKYGTSTKCVNGTGGGWAQDLYRIVNASLIANYDVKRCYEVDITFHYRIQGGLTSSTITNTRKTFSDRFKGMSIYLSSLSECSHVTVTRKDIINSPPGVSSVFFRIPLMFTASTSVPDNEVSKELTVCIRTLSTFKQLLDSSSPLIKQGDMTYSTYNLSSISNKTSCCGGDIPPPCCGVGSIRINSTKCGCLPGFKFVPDSLCVRCPSDTYQNKQGQRSCKKCAAKKQTFGKTGMTSESNCSDTNPLQLSDQVVYLPYDIKSETLVTNVTVTGRLESLVQPLLFYMENVTQQQLSRSESKRKRRDIDDFCEGAGTVKPMSYFCVHRLTGGIEVTDDFQFKNGDDFDVKIRVTDSDQWGKTENTAKIKFISRDNCKEIRAFYKDASKGCPKNASSAKGLDSCPSKECLRPLFDWLKRLNSSEMLQMECSSDPHNLANLARIYSKCIGPPVITVAPNPQTVKRGAKVILKCNASSSLPLTVMWFKNGMPIGQSGSQLKIDSFQYGDQGDYYCRFSTYLTSRPTASALVTMKDTFTSRVSFRIVNEKFKDDLLNPRSSSYSDMQITIERKLLNYLNSGNPGWNYVVKLVKFRDSFNKVGVDLVIYSSATNEDIVPYYSKLEALLADKRTMDNILQPLKVSRNSVTIRSATHCLSKETGKKSIMGIFEWQLTVIGGTSSPVSCPYGPPAANATRPCGGNFTTGGMWKSPDVSLCKFKSERTNKLNNIAKTKVNKQNAAKVTKEVKVLTSDPDDMNEADAVLIADVIDSVVLLDDSLNETAQDVIDVVDNVMKMKKKDLQESQRTSKSSSKFIRALDKVARNLPLSEGKNSRRLIAPSVAIQSNRVDPGSFTGMSLAVKPPTADPNKLTSENMVNDELPMADVQTSITLPEVIFENKAPSGKAVKIGFVIYQNDKFFQPVLPVDEESGQENSSIVSRVISSSVKDMTIENLTKPVELVFEPAVEVDTTNGESVCVFWDFDAMGGLGNWSDRGCRQVKIEAGRILCHCDHMTNFAVLFSAGGPKKHVEEHAKALSIISYIGCAISLVGLTLTLMTYAMFRNLRKTNQQPILMSLCVSLMLLLIVFIAGAAQTENLLGCRIVAILLHYFALATVMWMGVEGYNMYMSFVQVMGTYQSKFMLKASAVAWGVPAITVLVTLSAATSYYGNKDVCVLFGVPFQAAQFAPILLVILINFVVFILAIRALKHSGALVSAEKKSTSYLRARTSIAILLLLGLTWGFGALAVSSAQLIFDYLFCIFNSLQGFLIFYFHCLRHQEVRSQWKWFLLGKGLNFRPTETDSQTGYPRSNTQGKNVVYVPSSSLMMDKPPRKETVTFVAAESPPSLGFRPDVVPDQV